MAVYTLEPERRTLHGHFSRELEPVLTIDPSDTVRYRTLDAGWGLAPYDERGERPLFAPREPGLDDGHALCGPVFVRGAEPGMALEVHIGTLQPAAWGWNRGGGWDTPLYRKLGVAEGESRLLRWTLDVGRMVGEDQDGHRVALSPFMGVMGGPPPEAGVHPTAPPRVWGGNLDCKELTAGSTLFLPVAVPGALFSVGDGHAAQGDGEVSGTAIECPVERLELTFGLREDMNLKTPRAKTPQAWLSFGFHEDLNEATALALADMLSLMQGLLGVDRKDALALASVVVDLRVTQVVNGVCGVHAALPHGAVR